MTFVDNLISLEENFFFDNIILIFSHISPYQILLTVNRTDLLIFQPILISSTRWHPNLRLLFLFAFH
jgi:hypothetical protein